MNITVIGTASKQLTLHVTNLPKDGDSQHASSILSSVSGRGVMQAVSAARLGADVTLLCRFSEDALSTDIVRQLINENIRVLTIERSPLETSMNVGVLDDERKHFYIQGSQASFDLRPEDIEPYANRIRECSVLLLEQNIPLETMSAILALTALHNPFVILNPAPPYRLPIPLYAYVSAITPNADELAKLTGVSDLEEGVNILLGWGVKHVVVTLGDKGCYYAKQDESYFLEPFAIQVVDPSGVGDAFNAALAVSMAKGSSMRESLIFANAVAALCATQPGCVESLPKHNEVESFIQQY